MRYVTDLLPERPSVREADLALTGNDKMWKMWQLKNGHGLHEHSRNSSLLGDARWAGVWEQDEAVCFYFKDSASDEAMIPKYNPE